jgi:hypothetical protein
VPLETEGKDPEKSRSRKKSAAADRKMSCHAKVARRKRNIARKECTRANVVQEIQRMDVQEETSAGTRIQQWHKETRC